MSFFYLITIALIFISQFMAKTVEEFSVFEKFFSNDLNIKAISLFKWMTKNC